MTKVSQLEMAHAIATHPRIATVKGFLGIGSKTIYAPTKSAVKARTFDVSETKAALLTSILSTPADQLDQKLQSVGKIAETTLGTHRVEMCESSDHQFVAVQLLKFSQLMYHPATEARIYEGEDAKRICAIL